MGSSGNYEAAKEQYDRAIQEYKTQATNLYNEAYGQAQQYTGEEGYRKSVGLAKDYASQLAGAAAGKAQSEATAAARAQGMTRAQAALLGATQAAGAYGNTLNQQLAQQQGAAYQSGIDRSNAAYQKAGGVSGAYGQAAQGYGNIMNAEQQQEQNRFNRTMDIIKGTGQAAMTIGAMASDERTKDYVPTDEMVEYLQRHGLSRGKDDKQFDPVQLATGILVEQEHARDFNVALEIAKDHLVEDPQYYSQGKMPAEAVDRIVSAVEKYKIDLDRLRG